MSQETAQLITYEGQITDSKLSTVERNKIPMWTIKASMRWKGQQFLIQRVAGHGPWRSAVDAPLSGQRGGGRLGTGFRGPPLSKSSRHLWGWQAVVWGLFSSHVLLTAELLGTNLSNMRDREKSSQGRRRRTNAPWAIRCLPQDVTGCVEERWDDRGLPSLIFI